jgi:hypothetical protein
MRWNTFRPFPAKNEAAALMDAGIAMKNEAIEKESAARAVAEIAMVAVAEAVEVAVRSGVNLANRKKVCKRALKARHLELEHPSKAVKVKKGAALVVVDLHADLDRNVRLSQALSSKPVRLMPRALLPELPEKSLS